MKRIQQDVARGEAVQIEVDGAEVAVYPGETVAVALLGAQTLRFRDDRSSAPRGMFCNMGTCGECTVWIAAGPAATGWMRQRACLVPVAAGMKVRTFEPDSDHAGDRA